MTEADMENRQPGSLRELLRQLDAQGITDYRRYSRVRRFLSFKAREKNAGWRIDYFLVSNRLAGAVREAAIRTEIFGSDHCPVELQLDI